jgi:ribonuclease-3
MERESHTRVRDWRSLSSTGRFPLSSEENLSEVESPRELAERLKLPFNNLHLLARAMTHRSYVNEHPEMLEDNERLEFLGDAVLDFVVGAWLYNHCPEMNEGGLTRARSALVRTEQLAEFARQLGLDRAMRLGRGELAAGGRHRPALLCATFEALIGALYLQGGIPAVEKLISPLLEKAQDTTLVNPDAFDPKSFLQEWTQAQKLGTPRYVTVNIEGPDHSRIFEVEVRIGEETYGRGAGPSKHAASQAAAQAALEQLGLA